MNPVSRTTRRHSIAESYQKSLFNGGTITKGRTEEAPEHIMFTGMNGAHAIGATAEVIKADTYASDKKNIPLQAVPVGIKLWCFRQSPATNRSVIIHSSEFAPK